ncbi:hypothetical protein PO909_024887, partial [Leuciscus waleckii]
MLVHLKAFVFPPVAQWWNLWFSHERPVFESRSNGRLIMPPMLRSVSSLKGDCRCAFCSQRARCTTRSPAPKHRFYGSRASLAKGEKSVNVPLRPGRILFLTHFSFPSEVQATGNVNTAVSEPVVMHSGLQTNASMLTLSVSMATSR